eukprot:1160107-Pelagomonas_calceolata.AAC.3
MHKRPPCTRSAEAHMHTTATPGEDPCDALDACCRGHDLCLSSWRILLLLARKGKTHACKEIRYETWEQEIETEGKRQRKKGEQGQGRESCHTELVQCMDELDRNGAKGFSEETRRGKRPTQAKKSLASKERSCLRVVNQHVVQKPQAEGFNVKHT